MNFVIEVAQVLFLATSLTATRLSYCKSGCLGKIFQVTISIWHSLANLTFLTSLYRTQMIPSPPPAPFKSVVSFRGDACSLLSRARYTSTRLLIQVVVEHKNVEAIVGTQWLPGTISYEPSDVPPEDLDREIRGGDSLSFVRVDVESFSQRAILSASPTIQAIRTRRRESG